MFLYPRFLWQAENLFFEINHLHKAVELLQKYGDIERVRRALNHGSESVTLIYALADKQLENKYRRRRAAPGRRKV